MSKTAKNKEVNNSDLHPLCTNILKLKRFNFDKIDSQEILFFEWLIINYVNFGFKEFYRSDTNLFYDIGLKRTKLKNTRKKFLELEFLNIEVKSLPGYPVVHFYTIDFDILLCKLDLIYKKEYLDEMIFNYKDFIANKGKTTKLSKSLIPIDNLCDLYLKNTSLVNEILLRHNLDIMLLSKYLIRFNSKLKLEGMNERKEIDYIKHFSNWLSIEKVKDPIIIRKYS